MFGCSETLGLHLLDFTVEAQPRDSAGYFDEWCETEYKGDKKNDREKQNTGARHPLYAVFQIPIEKKLLSDSLPWKIKQNMSLLGAFEFEMRKQHVVYRTIF